MIKFKTWGIAAASFFLTAQNLPVERTQVHLGLSFLEESGLSSRMLHHRQELEFDLYLALLQQETVREGGILDTTIDELAKTTGLSRKMNQSVYSRLLHGALEVLEKEYHLVQRPAITARGDVKKKDRVVLKIVKQGERKKITLPMEYWFFQWDERFSFAGKIAFLVGLTLEQESAANNRGWVANPATIRKRFHLMPEVFEKGMLELRGLNLLEVRYHVDPNQPSRLQERWFLKTLYLPREIEEEIREFANEYGIQKVRTIRQYASVFYAEHDPKQVEQMILLYNRYGDYEFRKAMAAVAEEPHNSPKRSLEYATALMQGEAR